MIACSVLVVVISAASAAWAGPGSAGSGSAGSGSAAGSAAAGSGSAGSGAGSGSARIIQLPIDTNAPDVSAAASPTVVRLGAHFTLYVTATFDEGVEVNLPEPIELGPAFEVRRKLSEDRSRGDGKKTREWQIDVTPWELGDLEVPPMRVTFTAFGRAGQVQTNHVPMKIIGVLGDVVDDPKAMRGLAAPTGLTARDWFWIWLATAAGAFAAVVIGAVWFRTRRRRKTIRLVGSVVARPKRIDMTSERALERLLAIETSGVLDRDADRKAGYAEMVEVIRDYLGSRYRITIRDLTSSELLRKLANGAPPEEVALVAAWLDDCDLVKYGGMRSTPAEAGKALDDARALIVTTTQLRDATASKEAA